MILRSSTAAFAGLLVLAALLTLGSRGGGASQQAAIPEGVACATGVYDPYTLIVDGYDAPVRMAGVVGHLSPPLYRSTFRFMEDLLDEVGCRVWIEPAVPEWDPQAGVYRAWIWLDYQATDWYLLQRTIVWYGLAEIDERDPQARAYRPLLVDPEIAASVGGRGFWPPIAPRTPTPRPSPTSTPTTTPGAAATATRTTAPSVAPPATPPAPPPAPSVFVSPPGPVPTATPSGR